MTPSRLPAASSRICAPDRLLPLDPTARAVARRLYDSVATLPIISPHGHTDPRWYAENQPFPDPATLFVVPDHYVFRMLYAQGVRLEDLGVPTRDGTPSRPIRAPSGGASPRTITSSAAPRRGSGSTMPSPRSSASTSGCRRRTRMLSSTGSTRP